MSGRLFARTAALSILALLTGCQHSQKSIQATAPVAPSLPAPSVQVPPASVLKEQADAMASMQAEAPPPEQKPEEEPTPAQHPERRRPVQPPAPKPAAPATQTTNTAPAPATPTPEAVIGELSTGGDTSSQTRKQAENMIGSLRYRLDNLSGSVQRARKSALDQVRDFLKKATDALQSGDVEGAANLATKAKLILDDIKS